MKNSKKKSPVKSKKTIKKNPLRKYQAAGPVVTPTPALGSSSFSPTGSFGTGTLGASGFSTGNNNYGFNTGSVTGGAPSSSGYLSGNYTPGSTTFNNLYGGYDSGLDTTLNTRGLKEFSEDTNFGQKEDPKALDLASKPKPQQMTKGEIATTALGAVPGTVGAIASLASSSKVNDPSGYYDKKTKAKLEQYNKKIKASSAASAVGSGLLATSAAWGPLAFIPAAAGAITMAASEGAKASYQAKQGNLGTSYDERVADRMKYKESQAQRRQENLDRNAATNYYSQGSGLAKYGGMREFQNGGRVLPKYQNGIPYKPLSKQEISALSHQLRGMGPLNGFYTQKRGSTVNELGHLSPREQQQLQKSMNTASIGDQIWEGLPNLLGEHGASELPENSRLKTRVAPKYTNAEGLSNWRKEMEMQGYQKGGYAMAPSYENGGGYQKVTGPSHENGGIDMDLSGDGVNDAELEGGEIIEEMKHGGNAPKKYIWSDHLKTGGMSFAKKFEKLRKGGARPGDVEKLRIEQELAAKRDPSKLYAKYGGTMKYQEGGITKYQFAGPVPSVPTGWLGPPGPRQTAGPLAVASPGAVAASSTPSAKNQWLNAMLASNRPAGTNPNLSVFPMSQSNLAPGSTTAATGTTSQNQANTAPQNRVSRTGAGKFFAEYGAPMASLAGGIGDIAMNLSQKYNPVETVNARELTADKIYIDRAKDKQAGFRESELMGAKRASRAITGTGATQRENALRMTSLRAGEEAAQNIYDQNRQASTAEQKINLDAQMRVDEANRQTDLAESESRRNEGLRKESFENLRKKYIGSVVGQLGNELASGMYRKEYINATLPDGVNPYELKPGAYEKLVGTINPDTKKEYTPAEIWKAIHLKLAEERKS